MTDAQLATLARVLGEPVRWDEQFKGWVVGFQYVGPDWNLIGALLLKLRERGTNAAVYLTDFHWFDRNGGLMAANWTTPADLLAAIADACEGEK